MAQIQIEWLTDEHDCETCGWTFCGGARVTIDGQVALEMLPHAHCIDPVDYTPHEVFIEVLRLFGHSIDCRGPE